MERHVHVEYTGNCPSCGEFQQNKKPENVDTLCWKCQAAKGKIRYVKNIRGYDDDTVEIAIDTPEQIIVIRSYNPEIFINKKDATP